MFLSERRFTAPDRDGVWFLIIYMFNNLINSRDIVDLVLKVLRFDLRWIPSLVKKRPEIARNKWNRSLEGSSNWWVIPEVKRRWNHLISGDVNSSHYEYISRKYFSNKNDLHGISLGCGSGDKELLWAATGIFSKIDAYDFSESRITRAIKQAKETNYDQIVNFQVGNVETLDLAKGCCDVVIVEHALHHFSELEKLLQRVNEWIRPGGYLLVDEFVGPSRLQWTDRQLEIANGVLSILPVRYRTYWKGSHLRTKKRIFRASRLRMILNDPSESIESSKIMPLLRQMFDILELKEYGGTVLHLVFSGIAHNFLSTDRWTQTYLNLCFDIEDCLLESGEVRSDFAVVVCKKKS